MLNWIEKRTGFVSMTQEFLTEDVPGGASYWYVFGSATLFAMIVQIVTGIFLTFFYAPSAATAWESTRAIYLNPWTHFILSVHYWGASAMIALVFLHLLQVLIFGAYKSPREVQWLVGVVLLLVTLVLGLTGYLLPWDMDAYFASQVSLNIAGLPPGGSILQNIAQGGGTMGTATINRFFGLHVWLMPAVLVLLVGAHLAIFRHNGSAGPVTDDPRKLKKGRFWPDQMFMDAAVSFIVFIVIVFLALVLPPFLDAKADPTNSQFVPYPAWYFLSLFGLLALVPPELHVGADALPDRGAADSVDRPKHHPQLRIPARHSVRVGNRHRRHRRPFDLRSSFHDGQTSRGTAFTERSQHSLGGRSRNARVVHHGRRPVGAVARSRRRRKGLLDQLLVVPRGQRSRHARRLPAAGQQSDGHRRPEQGDRDRPQRAARSDHDRRPDLQRTDAGLERHALRRRRRRRGHLHPQLARRQSGFSRHHRAGKGLQALGGCRS
jgi:quinol-cytochrome oxidoreductase complex cytochrome b subunit